MTLADLLAHLPARARATRDRAATGKLAKAKAVAKVLDVATQ